MSIRGSQIYITRETRRMLSIIARAEGRESSADSVGERCLSEHITSRYPALAVLQKEIESIEGRMLDEVKK